MSTARQHELHAAATAGTWTRQAGRHPAHLLAADVQGLKVVLANELNCFRSVPAECKGLLHRKGVGTIGGICAVQEASLVDTFICCEVSAGGVDGVQLQAQSDGTLTGVSTVEAAAVC
jgi:hypothetical protein